MRPTLPSSSDTSDQGHPESYATVIILPKPTSLSEPKSESLDVRGRSLHFLNGGSKLLVSYLNHGIVYVFIRINGH